MYQVSDRTLRSYREHIRKEESFYIELKTTAGPVKIFVDGGGYATMRNPESEKFNLSIGRASRIVELIAKGEPLPTPGSSDFTLPVPTNLGPAIAEVTGQTLVSVGSTQEPTQAESIQVEPTQIVPIAVKQRAPRVDTRDIPNARKVIEAALSGAAHLRAKRDVLKTLPNGKREWRFTRRRPVNGKWQIVVSEVVALFEPTAEFTCPHSEEQVVIRRQEMLKLAAITERGDIA